MAQKSPVDNLLEEEFGVVGVETPVIGMGRTSSAPGASAPDWLRVASLEELAAAMRNRVHLANGGHVTAFTVADPIAGQVVARVFNRLDTFDAELTAILRLGGIPNLVLPLRCVGPEELPGNELFANGVMFYEKFDCDLFDLVSRGTPPKDLVGMMRTLLTCVRIMHARGVRHCDIKAENVFVKFVEGRPTFYLADFSCATTERCAHPDATAYASYGHMLPPEVFVGWRVMDTELCDIWQLGILLYVVLKADIPWDAPIASDPYYAYWAKNGDNDLPPAMRSLLYMMLTPENQRLSATDILTSLGN
jgi:serine/threonine protein kinase